jgi:hypothetical protein
MGTDTSGARYERRRVCTLFLIVRHGAPSARPSPANVGADRRVCPSVTGEHTGSPLRIHYCTRRRVIIANVSEAISLFTPSHTTRLPRSPPPPGFGGQVSRSQRRGGGTLPILTTLRGGGRVREGRASARPIVFPPCTAPQKRGPPKPYHSSFVIPAQAGIQRRHDKSPCQDGSPHARG